MTGRRELENLKKDMGYAGVKVTFTISEGWIDGVFIVGAKGLREHCRDPLSAAEAMREWLWKYNRGISRGEAPQWLAVKAHA